MSSISISDVKQDFFIHFETTSVGLHATNSEEEVLSTALLHALYYQGNVRTDVCVHYVRLG